MNKSLPNPLATYVKRNKLTLYKLAQDTGVSWPVLKKLISRTEPEDMSNANALSVELIKRHTGVDLISWLVDGMEVEAEEPEEPEEPTPQAPEPPAPKKQVVSLDDLMNS
jgi:hypothetical protein